MLVIFMTLVAIERPPVRGRVFVHVIEDILVAATTDPPDVSDLAEIANLRAVWIMTLLTVIESEMRIICRLVTF